MCRPRRLKKKKTQTKNKKINDSTKDDFEIGIGQKTFGVQEDETIASGPATGNLPIESYYY